MNWKEYKDLVWYEVFSEYKKAKGRLTLVDRFWRMYISPEGNATYLIRKQQYLQSRGGYCSILANLIRAKLMRRYGIHVNKCAHIGKGICIVHASNIIIGACTIGNDFTVYQNCTIGAKARKNGATPTIGSNVTMYTGSSVIGGVSVADGVSVGAHSLVVKDCLESGVYVGSPARKLGEKENG